MADTKSKREARARQQATGERYTTALAEVERTHEEDRVLERAEEIRRRRAEERASIGERTARRIAAVLRGDRSQAFSQSELRYAASSRCACGAGMAYPVDGPLDGAWDCSSILTGTAAHKGEPGATQHTARLPFAFWSVKSEDQPSAGGRTTRPA